MKEQCLSYLKSCSPGDWAFNPLTKIWVVNDFDGTVEACAVYIEKTFIGRYLVDDAVEMIVSPPCSLLLVCQEY